MFIHMLIQDCPQVSGAARGGLVPARLLGHHRVLLRGDRHCRAHERDRLAHVHRLRQVEPRVE